MKETEKEYIDILELFRQIRQAWIFQSLIKFAQGVKKGWWLCLLLGAIGFGIGHSINSSKKPSAEIHMLVNAKYLKKESLLHFVNLALSYDSLAFEEHIGLETTDYQNLKKIKKVNQVFRYDWFELTPFYGTANDNDYQWLRLQDIVVLHLEIQDTLSAGLSESLEALLEDSKPVKVIKEKVKSQFEQQEQGSSKLLQEIIRSYEKNKDLELFKDFYWRLRYEKIKSNYELNHLNNLSYYYLSSPHKIGGYNKHEVMEWTIGFLLLGMLGTLFLKKR